MNPIPLHGEDYLLTDHAVWITVKNLSVRVTETDEGVVVDIWPVGEEESDSLASTYAFFNDGLGFSGEMHPTTGTKLK